MAKWQKHTHLSDEELSRCDTAEVNLACAAGLPGAEKLDAYFCLRTLDDLTEQVRKETQRLAYLFETKPQTYQNSQAYFRMLVMTTVLQRDFGAHYSEKLKRMDDHHFFARADHLFLHGILQGQGGTCSSLPPLFLAVGRRLGYPLKLVTAYRHLFVRWHDPDGERLNFECTSLGLTSYPDGHYLTWPKQLSPTQVERYCALQSLSPRQ